jgi:hypothetical protein
VDKIKDFFRRNTAIGKVIVICLVFIFWAFSFYFLGLFVKFFFKLSNFSPIFLIIAIVAYFAISCFWSSNLIDNMREKKYFRSRYDPKNKILEVVLTLIFFLLVIIFVVLMCFR